MIALATTRLICPLSVRSKFACQPVTGTAAVPLRGQQEGRRAQRTLVPAMGPARCGEGRRDEYGE